MTGTPGTPDRPDAADRPSKPATPERLDALPARHFGGEVRLLREAAGLTQRALAARLRCSDTLVGFVENAQRPPTEQFAASCDVVFGTGGRLGRLGGLVRAFGAVRPSLAALLPRATELRASDPLLVPALAQTTDYARAVLQAHHLPVAAVDALLAARPTLTGLLDATPALRVWLILDETTLYRAVGGAPTLRAQLRHLLALIDTGQVVPQVLRTGGAATALLRLPQLLLGFADGTGLAHLPNLAPLDAAERYGDIGVHAHAFDLLRAAALPPGRSRGLIATASR